MLPALAACALLAVSAPVASAHKAHTASSLSKKLSAASGAIKGLKKTVAALFNNDAGQVASIHNVDGKVVALDATVQTILSGVPAIVNGLTALQTALQNPTTGLVGLNLARPQFGTFASAGTIIGGTGQVTGASGPKADATHPAGGTYVVDFGNDVSKRSLNVAASPGLGAVVGEAVDCANAGGTCPGGDTSANHVMVLTYVLAASPTTATNAGFTVTAISG
jgi:hypothetical protein